MMRFADPPQHDSGSPFPPAYSRLAADPLHGPDDDAAPAHPYYGPAGPAPRGRRRGGAVRASGAVQARVEQYGASVARSLPPVADRTAAHGVPLAPQPDDARTGVDATRDGRTEPRGVGGGRVPSRPASRSPSLAAHVADQLEQLASRLRAHGDPRLAVATDSGEPLDAVVADIVGDYLRDQGA